MRASESTNDRILIEKRCGTPGRTAPHYKHNPREYHQHRRKPNHIMHEKGTARTNTRRTTHGARTSAAKNAEMGLGGSFCSGWKVCTISGRVW
jgi:hypothetical protein